MFDPVSRIFLILLTAAKDTFSNKDSSELSVWAPWTGSTCLFFVSPVCRVKLGHVNNPNWLQVFYFNIKIHQSFQCPFLYQPWSPENPAKQHCWSRVQSVVVMQTLIPVTCLGNEQGSGLSQLCFSTPLDFPLLGVVRPQQVRPACCYQRYSQFPMWFISKLMRL